MEKILLVEDDATLIRMLSDFLTEEGFLIEAVNGQTLASTAMKNSNFDLALVDVMLEEGNGFSVCSEAKRKNIPVIF